MPRKTAISDDPGKLRRAAEARLRKRARDQKSDSGDQRLLHELQVHQIELQMQNAELQKARDELEAGLQQYTDLYDFAPVGYFSLDESGVIHGANLTGAAMLGVDRSRLINRRWLLFVSPTSRPAFLAFLERVFNRPEEQACEALLLNEGGDTFWAGIRAAPAAGLKAGRKWCRVAVSDISVRKQAEDVLLHNEALFSALIAQAPVGVYVLDGRLRLQQVNPRARPVFKKIHPLIGRDFSEIIRIIWPAKTADKIMEHFRHTLKTGEPYYSSEFSERRRDIGVTEYYEWQLQRITLPAGQVGVVCFFDDITERKRTEETQRRLAVLAASNQKLEREIVRRQAVEKALQKSEQHQTRLSEQARHLSHQTLHAQEEERKRISRELHDVIAQTLVGINVRLAALTRAAAGNPRGLRQKIAQTQRLVEKSVDVVHRFARELRPTVLDDLGLIPALHAFMKEFTKRTGVRAHLTAFAGIEKLSITGRTVLYRVAHEALNNVARHAQASRVEVNIEKLPNTIGLKIKDDGKGFRPERVLHAKERKRLGLLGMRERVEMIKGNFAIESILREGTTICAQIPFSSAGGRKTR